MLKLIIALLLAGCVLQGCAGPTKAQSQPESRIGFVRLQMTDSTVTLVQATVRPGRLKSRRSAPAEQALAFDVLSGGTDVVWTGSLEDPLVERIEYVDEEGRLQTRVTRREQAEVTIRIPVTAPRHTIRLYRTVGPEKAGRSLLGSVEVSL